MHARVTTTSEGHVRRRVLDKYRRVLGTSCMDLKSVEEVEVDNARAHCVQMMCSKRHLPDIEQWSQRSGSNVIPRRARPGLAGLRPHGARQSRRFGCDGVDELLLRTKEVRTISVRRGIWGMYPLVQMVN